MEGWAFPLRTTNGNAFFIKEELPKRVLSLRSNYDHPSVTSCHLPLAREANRLGDYI